ncbi:MAG TPA: anthrone oxygenase family protein [Rhodanobacteraceae bacterium]|nr:anthrone oxygenase family protein [Rhodanobacteraceae bacterium]
MTTQWIGRWLAIFCIALLAGIYLGDVVGVRHARMNIDPAGFVEMQQAIHMRFVRLMPPLILGALIGNLLWLWSLRGQAWSWPFWLVLASIAGIIAIALMTRVVSVPLNQQLMGWSAVTPPADIRQLWQPWERVNQWRLGIALALLGIELSLLVRKQV